MPPCVVGVHVRDAVGLHEYREKIGLHPSGLGDTEINVRTDVGLGVLQLRSPVALVRVLVKTSGVSVIKLRIVFDIVRAAVHRNESFGFIR